MWLIRIDAILVRVFIMRDTQNNSWSLEEKVRLSFSLSIGTCTK